MATASGKKNTFAIWVSVAVIVVIALVVGLAVWMNSMASAPAARPASTGIDQTTGAIVVGDAADDDVVSVYFDFYCPHCQEFEKAYGDTIEDVVTDGSATLHLHPVALSGLNAASGTDFSKRASNALYCVAEDQPDAAFPFYVSLFAKNPSGAGLTDDELIALAGEAGADGVADCVADRTWDDLVAEQTTNLPEGPDGGQGTPTLLVNGEYVTLTGDPEADITARVR